MIKNPDNFFRRLGANVRDRYREHIFGKAKDVHDKPFKQYRSKQYAERKAANKFKRQASNYASSKAPVLTSDLLRDFSLIRTSRGSFELGWVTHGAKVKWLAKVGRELTTKRQPFPDKLNKYMEREVFKAIEKSLPNKTTRHKL